MLTGRARPLFRRVKAACGHWIEVWVELDPDLQPAELLAALEDAVETLSERLCHACLTGTGD